MAYDGAMSDVTCPNNSHPAAWLTQAARLDPEALACRYAGESLSYRQLETRVDAVAQRLAALCDGRVIAHYAFDPFERMLVMLACLRLGCAWLPLDPALDLELQLPLLRQTGCKWVLTDTITPAPRSDHKCIPIASLFDAGACLHKVQPADTSPETISLIVPTSGTSGEPKGVMLSGANLAASVAAVNRRLGYMPGDSWLACLPLSHIGGLAIPLRCLLARATLVLHANFDAARVWQALKEEAITHISLVPPMLDRLLDEAQGKRPPHSLRVVLIGGGALDPALAKRAHDLGWPLAVSYGMTETGSLCAVDDGPQAGLEAGRVGSALPGFELALSPTGELRVRGPAAMAGYANPALQPGQGLDEGWFNSGDIGALDEHSGLHIEGRSDERVNSGGLRLWPQTVEEMLLACPGIREVGVTARADPVWGDRLVALYVGDISIAELEVWAREHLPGSLRPREFQQVDALPHTALGKLNRSQLQRCIQSVSGADPAAGPGSLAQR